MNEDNNQEPTMSNEDAQELIDSVEAIHVEEIELNEEDQEILGKITEQDEEIYTATQKVVEKTIVDTIDEVLNRVNSLQTPRFKTGVQIKSEIVDTIQKMKSDFIDTLDGE